MFRPSQSEKQLNLFSSVAEHLKGTSHKLYTDKNAWHNVFREQIVSRIKEELFSVLFDDKMGAPNAPVNVLVGMMVIKEAFGWSDASLFEACRFNLLVRSAIGLFNIDDEVPAPSTYYLFCQRIHAYERKTLWAICRCLWINLIRIIKYIGQLAPNNLKRRGKIAIFDFLREIFISFFLINFYIFPQAKNFVFSKKRFKIMFLLK